MRAFLAMVLFCGSTTAFAQIDVAPSATPDPAPNPLLTPTYSSIRDIVFVTKCLQCHAAGEDEEDHPLDDYDRMMARGKLVVPFDLQKSKVVKEIVNGKMPPRRSGIPPVTDYELAAIKTWILNGAPKE